MLDPIEQPSVISAESRLESNHEADLW